MKREQIHILTTISRHYELWRMGGEARTRVLRSPRRSALDPDSRTLSSWASTAALHHPYANTMMSLSCSENSYHTPLFKQSKHIHFQHIVHHDGCTHWTYANLVFLSLIVKSLKAFGLNADMVWVHNESLSKLKAAKTSSKATSLSCMWLNFV